jgi:hypothetical protein
MSNRLRNNLIAGLIVIVFWVTLVIPTVVRAADPIVTNSTANSTVTSNATTKSTVRTNPPSAISPSINASNSDLCTVGVAGAVQTQIIGISTGQVYNDENCVRLKNAKVLYDMGMKVAAVSLMCQSRSVYDSMKFAGTPCPINNPVTGEGLIGTEATAEWRLNPKKIPKKQQTTNMDRGVFLEKLVSGIISVILFAILLV